MNLEPAQGVSTGRSTWRRRTTSCGRREAFSVTSAAFVLVRSPTELPMSSPAAGLVYARRRRWTARRQGSTCRRIAVQMVVTMRCSPSATNGIGHVAACAHVRLSAA